MHTIGNIAMSLVLSIMVACTVIAAPITSAIHTNPTVLNMGNPFS